MSLLTEAGGKLYTTAKNTTTVNTSAKMAEYITANFIDPFYTPRKGDLARAEIVGAIQQALAHYKGDI